MKAKPQKKSEATRERILEEALALFRKHGFDGTKMRDIATAAELALGAAYYYFPSKEAIVLAYYERAQRLHEAAARDALAGVADLRARLGIVVHTKLDVVKKDRKLLGALVRSIGEPDDALSVFGDSTSARRSESVAIFREAFAEERLSPELEDLLASALWLLHLGFLLRLVHDRSAQQSSTRALVDGVLDLIVPLVALAKLPQAGPLVQRLTALVSLAATP